ncbi:MAG: c-type cytochrome, partial [Dehalococcoidia bacterium]|nr:c-type cytochrome [Dehalococcoidia bacterium]
MKQEQKQQYLKRYAELKKKGKAFYPYSIFKDVAISGAVLLVLLLLIVAFGVPLENKADPTNTSYIPRPEWYFMFLFEALKYFPGELEWVGVVVVPTITLLILLLFPFLDFRPQRRPSRRPLAIGMATLTVLFSVFLTYSAFQNTPSVTAEKLSPVEQSGRRIYQAQNCAVCHAIKEVGGKAGPDLAGVSDTMDAAKIHLYIENPKAVNPNATMGGFTPP